MEVHKVILSIVDFDGVGASDIKTVIENVHYPNRCISPKVESIETKDIGEWDDSHPLNHRDKASDYFRGLFDTGIHPAKKPMPNGFNLQDFMKDVDDETLIALCEMFDEMEAHERQLNEQREDSAGLLRLVYRIREAVGDPHGKLMQDELVERCRELHDEHDWLQALYDMECLTHREDLKALAKAQHDRDRYRAALE